MGEGRVITPTVLEAIVCTAEGVFCEDGTPWRAEGSAGATSHVLPNLFYTDDGALYIGQLHRVQLDLQSWAWQIPDEQAPSQLVFWEDEHGYYSNVGTTRGGV